jgi:DNA-binding CsgD family transcriptional regulator
MLQRTERLTHLGEVKADRPIYCYTAPLFCTSDAMPSAGEAVGGWRLETKVCVLDFSDKPADRLLDLIYDAATDAELWTSALIQIADVTSSVGGIVFGVDNGVHRVAFICNGRLSEEGNHAYRERHVTNPHAAFMNHSPVGKLVRSDEVVPLANFKRTAFFDEVYRPQGIAHNAMVPLVAKDDFQAGFTLCRSERQGPYEADELRLLSQLYPHLRRALLLGFRLDGYKALQRAEYHVLDRLSVGVILLDRRARLLYANAAARALDSRDGLLRLRGATVSAQSPPHSRRLGELVRMALLGAPTGSMSLPQPGDGGLLTILVSSVRGRDVGRFTDLRLPDPAVLLFIVDPANRPGLPVAWIVDAYGLTPAEARVALAASSGLTIPETAHQLGLSPNTIKTHLRKVFAKTGTSRQTELARLMASINLLAHATAGKDGS